MEMQKLLTHKSGEIVNYDKKNFYLCSTKGTKVRLCKGSQPQIQNKGEELSLTFFLITPSILLFFKIYVILGVLILCK